MIPRISELLPDLKQRLRSLIQRSWQVRAYEVSGRFGELGTLELLRLASQYQLLLNLVSQSHSLLAV